MVCREMGASWTGADEMWLDFIYPEFLVGTYLSVLYYSRHVTAALDTPR